MKVKENLLNILFPKNFTCVLCGEEIFDNSYLCDNCKSNLPKIDGDICLKCGEPIKSQAKYCNRCQNKSFVIDKIRCAFVYEDKIALALKNLKFNNHRYLVKPLALFLKETYIKENFDVDIITYVPMHEKKLKERGFNHAELLAKELGKMLNIEVSDSLIKTKETKLQVDLDYKHRQENLVGAFNVINKNDFKNKKVLIIDDIFTTGATLNCCAESINKAKPNKIYALCVAHTMYEL